ncbi:MAG: DUF3179 domain-containing protein [Candidatus Hodarchaeales archaeon]|jgi:hypothetical protein
MGKIIRFSFLFTAIISLLLILYSYDLASAVGEECLVPCDDIENVISKDAIPAIDKPKFLTTNEFESQYSEDYLDSISVIGVVVDGEARAYPIDILDWHEIVNDNFGGNPISVTYCPLTGSGIVYNTTALGGSTLGTTGKLYENNLVFYDRSSDTSWSQMLGLAIKGEKINQSLGMEPVIETSWKIWKTMHPTTKILSRDTGFTRNYDLNPYPGYRERKDIWFRTSFIQDISPYNLYHEKSLGLVLTINSETRIYPFEELENISVANDVLGNQSIAIFFDKTNKVVTPFFSSISFPFTNDTTLYFSMIDNSGIDTSRSLSMPIFQDQTGTSWNMLGEAITGELEGEKLEQIPSFNAFWFASTAFFPEAGIFTSNSSIVYIPTYDYGGNDQPYTTGLSPLILLPLTIFGLYVIQKIRKKTKMK